MSQDNEEKNYTKNGYQPSKRSLIVKNNNYQVQKLKKICMLKRYPVFIDLNNSNH